MTKLSNKSTLLASANSEANIQLPEPSAMEQALTQIDEGNAPAQLLASGGDEIGSELPEGAGDVLDKMPEQPGEEPAEPDTLDLSSFAPVTPTTPVFGHTLPKSASKAAGQRRSAKDVLLGNIDRQIGWMRDGVPAGQHAYWSTAGDQTAVHLKVAFRKLVLPNGHTDMIVPTDKLLDVMAALRALVEMDPEGHFAAQLAVADAKLAQRYANQQRGRAARAMPAQVVPEKQEEVKQEMQGPQQPQPEQGAGA